MKNLVLENSSSLLDIKNIINQYFKKYSTNSNIRTIYTGLKTMTGGRVKRLKSLIGDETLMTYGDGISNPNLNKLIKLHFKNKNIATLTAVRPPARFGAIKLNLNKMTYFKEKISFRHWLDKWRFFRF